MAMTMRMLLVLVLVLACSGCERKAAPFAEDPSTTSGVTAEQPSTSGKPGNGNGITSAVRNGLPKVIQAGKVEFRQGEGEELFSFRPKDDGAACKLYDSEDNELCKLTFTGSSLKAKTADDKPLFELKPKDDKLMIKDATGENELFKFKLKGDTIDFYLPGDQRVYRIKRQDYGWRLEDNSNQTLFRAKSKDGKMVLRDAEDKTVLYSNDIPSPLGLVFFQIKELNFEQQAACCVFFIDR
jgi:hypothetical protein